MVSVSGSIRTLQFVLVAGNSLAKSGRDRVHLVARLFERPHQDAAGPRRGVYGCHGSAAPIDHHRQEDLRARCSGSLLPSDFAERPGHDADDLIAFAVERDRAPDDVGSPPNRLRHSDSPSTTTRALARCSSSGRRVRPTIGGTRSTRNNEAVTKLPLTSRDHRRPSASRRRSERRRSRRSSETLRPRQIVERRGTEERRTGLEISSNSSTSRSASG